MASTCDRSSDVDYGPKKQKTTADPVYDALMAVARGKTLRQAESDHNASYTSLHRAWVALEGNIEGPKPKMDGVRGRVPAGHGRRAGSH